MYRQGVRKLYAFNIMFCFVTAGVLVAVVLTNSARCKETSNYPSDELGVRPSLEPVIRTQHMHARTINISEHCLSRAKLFLNLQRDGWGSMSAEDLYRGAYETYNANLVPFLPDHVPQKVLDIGCGMALYDTFVFKRYGQNSNFSLYLLDKSTDEVHSNGFKQGGFNPVGKFSFYTSLECARQTLIDNGAHDQQVHAIRASATALDNFDSNSFDFVFSLLSWGYHYPITTYLDGVKRIMKSDARLLVDLRCKRSAREWRAMASSTNYQHTMASVVRNCEGGADLQNKGFECEAVHRAKGVTVLCGHGATRSR